MQVAVVPEQPLLERTLYGQALNCDFRFTKSGPQPLELRVVQLAVRDAGGGLTLFNPSQLVEFDRVFGSTRVRADGTSPDSGTSWNRERGCRPESRPAWKQIGRC